jgi:ABC-type Fe3+-hydroxamate transport system substrate-binding protein
LGKVVEELVDEDPDIIILSDSEVPPRQPQQLQQQQQLLSRIPPVPQLSVNVEQMGDKAGSTPSWLLLTMLCGVHLSEFNL